jgi:hypothetical protein
MQFHSKRPARKVHPNDAGLFLVSAETAPQSTEEQKETPETPLKLTCDLPIDTATAFRCVAFLMEFFGALETGDLRRIADGIRERHE